MISTPCMVFYILNFFHFCDFIFEFKHNTLKNHNKFNKYYPNEKVFLSSNDFEQNLHYLKIKIPYVIFEKKIWILFHSSRHSLHSRLPRWGNNILLPFTVHYKYNGSKIKEYSTVIRKSLKIYKDIWVIAFSVNFQ